MIEKSEEVGAESRKDFLISLLGGPVHKNSTSKEKLAAVLSVSFGVPALALAGIFVVLSLERFPPSDRSLAKAIKKDVAINREDFPNEEVLAGMMVYMDGKILGEFNLYVRGKQCSMTDTGKFFSPGERSKTPWICDVTVNICPDEGECYISEYRTIGGSRKLGDRPVWQNSTGLF